MLWQLRKNVLFSCPAYKMRGALQKDLERFERPRRTVGLVKELRDALRILIAGVKQVELSAISVVHCLQQI